MSYPIEEIEGIGAAYAEKLSSAGNLAAKMAEVNEQKTLTRQVPFATQVTKWVEQAKELEPLLSY